MNREKKSRKEIENTLRNKIVHQYNKQIELYKRHETEWYKSWEQVTKRCQDLEEENAELKEKLQSQSDWIERLQEFVNLPDDVRKQEIENFKNKQKFESKFQTFLADNQFLFELASWLR